MKAYKNLVLSGGSVRGVCHIGALTKLFESGCLNNLESYAGASVGAIITCFLALGFSIAEIWDFIYKVDMAKLVDPNIMMFLTKFGVDEGNIMYDLIENILIAKTGIKKITFKQLHDFTNKTLTIIGSGLTTKTVIYYNHINTPDFEVALAVRISISIPGFFTPVTIDDKKYIDGAILNNYPMNLYKDDLDNTIGILIVCDYDTDYQYPEQYPFAVFNLFLYHNLMQTYNQYEANTVYVDCSVEKEQVSHLNSGPIFNVDTKSKEILYKIGYDSSTKFLTKFTI